MTSPVLCHFAAYRWRDAYWQASASERGELWERLPAALAEAAPRVELYQLFPTRPEADLLMWSAAPSEEPADPAGFFAGLGAAIDGARRYLEPVATLWGFTRPSPYVRSEASRGIDAIDGRRRPYLVVYPFTKTPAWYLLSRETRQGMMNEHMRIGHAHAGVDQLLLYSFGLQDQEFVVVYETADLPGFSRLVQELRETEARRYTARDTPVFTALHVPLSEAAARWGG